MVDDYIAILSLPIIYRLLQPHLLSSATLHARMAVHALLFEDDEHSSMFVAVHQTTLEGDAKMSETRLLLLNRVWHIMFNSTLCAIFFIISLAVNQLMGRGKKTRDLSHNLVASVVAYVLLAELKRTDICNRGLHVLTLRLCWMLSLSDFLWHFCHYVNPQAQLSLPVPVMV